MRFLVGSVSVASATASTPHGATASVATAAATTASTEAATTTATSTVTEAATATAATASEPAAATATATIAATAAVTGALWLGRVAFVAFVAPGKVGVSAFVLAASPVSGTSLEVGLFSAVMTAASAAAAAASEAASSAATASKSAAASEAATATVVAPGGRRSDHGHLDFDGGPVEVFAVEPFDGAVGGCGIVVGDGGFTLLGACVPVLVDPDLLLAGPLVGLDHPDGPEELADVVF